MASVSSTSSLGNTALRGFGGMASGIDRDSIIEKMTLGTTTKISNEKKKVTQLQWKQEAYRSVSDKLIDWSDTYASYASSKNLKDPTVFSKNQITVHGKDESTSRISVTGSSSMVDNVSIKGVAQTATSTVLQSSTHINAKGIQTTVSDLNSKTFKSSNLAGQKLWFVGPEGTDGTRSRISFTFGDSYETEVTNPDGTKTMKKININYAEMSTEDAAGRQKILDDLNGLLKDSSVSFGEGKSIGDVLEFQFDGDNHIQLVSKGNGIGDYKIDGQYSSRTLAALGYENSNEDENKEISLGSFNSHVAKDFEESAVTKKNGIQVFTNEKVTFNYNGSSKSIALITTGEAEKLKGMSSDDQLTEMAKNIQNRLNQAYGKGAVTAEVVDGKLTFNTDKGTVSVRGDASVLSNMGLQYGSSNKVNLDGKLTQDALPGNDLSGYVVKDEEGNDTDRLNLVINGVSIGGLTKNSSVSDILSKINSTKAAGVKATYVDATGQFTLVSSETGEGREISLDSKLAEDLFGRKMQFENEDGLSGYATDANGDIEFKIKGEDGQTIDITGIKKDSTVQDIVSRIEESLKDTDLKLAIDSKGKMSLVGADGKTAFALDEGSSSAFAKDLLGANSTIRVDGSLSEGRNAQILVSYGNGVDVMLERSSNTFNLEGLTVTVSGEFGDVEGSDAEGWTSDSSQAVTFSAKADVEGALEKVKSFIEDYNALVTEINDQIRTRPDSSYAPLTDEQKAEMDETSIENWEKKAKQGLLYGDSVMRDLSMDIQGVFTKMMSYGASYEDLKEIGITYAEDWGDGGTLVFDEAKFKSAMETDPDKVSDIFTGGGSVRKGLIDTIDETFVPYATRYANKNGNGTGKGSYGRLIEVAGSEKKPSTLLENEIYKQLKEMQETIDGLNDRLKIEQDRYISQFTTMETLLNQMNTQASYLSQLTA